MIKRNLDGIFFRVKRDDKFYNICFSDLVNDEMDEVLEKWNESELRRMCKMLGKTIREIGDQLDIVQE